MSGFYAYLVARGLPKILDRRGPRLPMALPTHRDRVQRRCRARRQRAAPRPPNVESPDLGLALPLIPADFIRVDQRVNRLSTTVAVRGTTAQIAGGVGGVAGRSDRRKGEDRASDM